MAEGGIRNALIVSGPVVQREAGSINHGFMHVADIMPTLLDVAGTAYPETVEGRPLPAMVGNSWSDVLAGVADSPRNDDDYMGWELFGNRAIRQGNWKFRWQWKPFGTEEWELFNLADDPGERIDLAAEMPNKMDEMHQLWDDYVAANNVQSNEPKLFRLGNNKS